MMLAPQDISIKEKGTMEILKKAQPKPEQKDTRVAEAINGEDALLTHFTNVLFAENAVGGPKAWEADGSVAINRLRIGRYGKTLKAVLDDMSSAVKTDSPQYKKAVSGDFNFFEQLVYDRIQDVAKKLISGEVTDPTGGATHFENIEEFGRPGWAEEMAATKKIGRHTYFKEK